MTVVGILCFHLILISENIIASRLGTLQTAQEKLYEKLLMDYSKSSKPMNNQKSPLNISFRFELIKIYEVNAKLQRMSVVSLVKQEWRDESLCWNASDYSGFSTISISPSKIWVPDIGLYNEVINKDHKKTGVSTHIVVDSTGTCRWTFPLFLHVMCSIDVSFFPLDLQQCSLHFGSFSYSSREILITPVRLVHSSKIMHENGEWWLYKTSVKTENVWDDTRMNNFSTVEISFNMERNSEYYFIEMLVPCFLISCLTILGFILPPESGERMSLGMLILLAMTFFQQLTMKMVPLQDFPLISQYFFVTTVEIALALLITTLTLNFYYRSHSKMPGFLKFIILHVLGKITRIRLSPKEIKPEKCKRSFRLSERKFQLSSSSQTTNCELQFDIELTETCTSGNDILETSLNNSTVGLVSFKSMDENSSTASTYETRGNEDGMEENGIEKDSSDWNKDWVLASRIVDRFSMYASIVIGILTVFIVFIRAPRFWTSRTGIDE